MSFAADIEKFALNASIKTDELVRKLCTMITADLVRATPVGDPKLWKHKAPKGYVGGLARSSWFFGITPNREQGTIPDASGSPSTERSLEFSANLKAGGTFYISNNLPYIEALEYGHSTQAPSGMARITVANFQAMVDSAARAVNP